MLGHKVIYVRCINFSYNNVAKGNRLLEKKQFCLCRNKFMQVRAFERYIPLISAMHIFIKYVNRIFKARIAHFMKCHLVLNSLGPREIYHTFLANVMGNSVRFG